MHAQHNVVTRSLRIVGIVLGGLGLLGCSEPELGRVEVPPPPEDDGCPSYEGGHRSSCAWAPVENQVDVLFVVDAGKAATPWQVALADAMPILTDAVASAPRDIDLRVGVVPAQRIGDCGVAPNGAGSGGRFVHEVCRDRLVQFGDPNLFAACEASCEGVSSSDALWWSAHDRASAAEQGDALQCRAFVGDRGCVPAEPLGSTFAVLLRAVEDGVFFRTGAAAFVVMLVPGDDCTVTELGQQALGAASPGECWQEATDCVEVGPSRWRCSEGISPALWDGARLLGALERLAFWADLVSSQLSVHVTVWAGWNGTDDVPAPHGDASVPHVCTVHDHALLPPTRLSGFLGRVAEAGVDTSKASLCSQDAASGVRLAMAQLAARVVDAVLAGCLPLCVADDDPERPGVQPACWYEARWNAGFGTQTLALADCIWQDGDWQVPDGASGCAITKTEGVSPSCLEWSNAEVELRWRGPRPGGMALVPACRWAQECE